MTCDVCGQSVDPDTAHWPHQPHCQPGGDCRCDHATHPQCRPQCWENTDV